jgi:ribosome-associated toxin RatA of RatAB toxin-antitoxin module
MPKVQKQLIVPYSNVQIYDLINDIQAYPEYLPWCQSALIHEQSAKHIKATLNLAKGPLTYSITTLNNMQPHSSIRMQYVAGPFKSCSGSWDFRPLQDPQQSEIIFTMEYEFKNFMTALAVEPVFNPIANTLIDAFLQRAAHIYGN